MTAPHGYLLLLAAHARDVPVGEREHVAEGLEAVVSDTGGFLLHTCHRVEAYLPGTRAVPGFPVLPERVLRLADSSAVEHAITLAAGLDSAVPLEDEVLHQIRRALAAARAGRELDPLIERLFAVALRTGRLVRSWRSSPPASLADRALDLLEARRGRPLRAASVLVVGAGAMGRLAAEALRRRGARVGIASRTDASARALAEAVAATAEPFDPGPSVAERDGVVVCLRGRWSIAAETAEILAGGATVVADLSAPPALPPDLTLRLGARAISVDELAEEGAGRSRGYERERRAVAAAVREFEDWLGRRGSTPTIQALAERFETERSAELEHLWRRLPALGEADRAAIDGMSRHLVARILREPLARLAEDADGRRGAAARDLFGL